MQPSLVISLLGPTASGKSGLAMELAPELEGEILCLDSTTVYQGFDVGTGKPSPEDQARVPHHLLDILEPSAPFTAGDFVRRAETAIEEVGSRSRTPLVVGGTYFYLRALENGMYPGGEMDDSIREAVESRYDGREEELYPDLKKRDPRAVEKIHPNDRYRLIRAHCVLESGQKPSELKAEGTAKTKGRIWLKYAVLLPRHELHRRIEVRCDAMLEAGWVEEVRALRDANPEARALGSVGYASVVAHLDGKLSAIQMRNQIIERTRQLAKRQMTWLRGDPHIRFVDLHDKKRILQEWSNLQETLGRSQ